MSSPLRDVLMCSPGRVTRSGCGEISGAASPPKKRAVLRPVTNNNSTCLTASADSAEHGSTVPDKSQSVPVAPAAVTPTKRPIAGPRTAAAVLLSPRSPAASDTAAAVGSAGGDCDSSRAAAVAAGDELLVNVESHTPRVFLQRLSLHTLSNGDHDKQPAPRSGSETPPAPLTPPPPPSERLVARHFLRCHSGADVPPVCDLRAAATDTATPVTCCRLETCGSGGGDATDARVASCGGRVVCIVHVCSGRLLRRFTDPQPAQRYSALAWSRLAVRRAGSDGGRITVLAVAGRQGTIGLFHPDYLTRYCCFAAVSRAEQLQLLGRFSRQQLLVVQLQFERARPAWLYCAVSYGGRCGQVRVWHVGEPAAPPDGYAQARPRPLLVVETEQRVPRCLAVGRDHLAVGTDCELFVWRLPQGAADGNAQPTIDEPCGFDTSPQEGAVVGVAWLACGTRLAVQFGTLNRVLVWTAAQLTDPSVEDPFTVRPLQLPHRAQTAIATTTSSELQLSGGVWCCGADVDGDWPPATTDSWLVCAVAQAGVAVFRVHGTTGEQQEEEEEACLEQLVQWPVAAAADSAGGAPVTLVDEHLSGAGKLPLRADSVAVLSVAASATCRQLVVTTDVNMLCVWSHAPRTDPPLSHH